MTEQKSTQDIIDSLTDILRESKNFHKVIIYGKKTNVIIEKPINKQEEKKE